MPLHTPMEGDLPFGRTDVALCLVGITLGLALLAAILAETVWSMVETDYGGGNYWCASVGA